MHSENQCYIKYLGVRSLDSKFISNVISYLHFIYFLWFIIKSFQATSKIDENGGST